MKIFTYVHIDFLVIFAANFSQDEQNSQEQG